MNFPAPLPRLYLALLSLSLSCSLFAEKEAEPAALIKLSPLESSLKVDFEHNLDFEAASKRIPQSVDASKLGLEFVPGVSGEAIRIPGNASFTLPATFISSTAGTISFWFKRSISGYNPWPFLLLSPQGGKGPSINFNQWTQQFKADLGSGASCMFPFSTPCDKAWHHVALTWKEGGNTSLYYDGGSAQNSVKKAAPQLAWDFKNLVFSSGIGHSASDFMVMDGLRLFASELSAADIKALMNQDCPISMDLNDPVPSKRVVSGETGSFAKESFSAAANSDVDAKILLQTLGQDKKELWREEIPLKLKAGEKAEFTWIIPMGDASELATLKATLVKGKGGPSWAADIARVLTADTKAASNVESRRRLLHVDCTVKVDDNFASSAPTTVEKTPIGDYRSTPPGRHVWFAYRFNVENPDKPHILSVEYPDDMPRIMAFDIIDGSGRPPQGSGVITGSKDLSGQRSSNSMRRRDMVFWPATKNCALFVCDWRADAPASIASFDVYELSDGKLPAVSVRPLPAGLPERHFGTYIEDASMTLFCGSRQKESYGADLKQWVSTSENLASFMQHTGQNAYYYPMFWYSGPLFQSPINDPSGSVDGVRLNHPDGAYDILLKTFEKHGIKFMPMFAFKWMASLGYQTDRPPKDQKTLADWTERYRGHDIPDNQIFQFSREGKIRDSVYGSIVPGGGSGVGPIFNPLHPEVQAVFLGLVDDWLKLYGDYPSMGGIAFDLGVGWGGCPGAESMLFERLESGYGDFTIAKFTRETGIKVPGAAGDESRFKARYDFLTAEPMREKWINWRCERIRDELILPMARKVWERRPDLQVTLAFSGNPGVGSKLLNKNTGLKEGMKECGFDVDLYKEQPRLSVVCLMRAVSARSVSYPESNLPDVLDKIIDGRQAGVIGYWSEYWERFAPLYEPAVKDFWPDLRPQVGPVRTITEQGMFMLRDGIMALAKEDISTILVGGMGQNPWQGNSEDAAYFGKAFRSLPAVKFSNVPGLEDPVRVRQWTSGSDTYAYLLNTEPYEIKVDLMLERPSFLKRLVNVSFSKPEILDLVSEKAQKLEEDGTFSVAVPPYQIRSFLLQNTSIKGGKALVPEKESRALGDAYATLKENMSKDKKFAAQWETVSSMMGDALKEGHYARTRALATVAAPAIIKPMNWLMFAPFSPRQGNVWTLDVARPIESTLLSEIPSWKDAYDDGTGKPVKSMSIRSSCLSYGGVLTGGMVDLTQYFSTNPVLAYAITNLRSDRDREIKLPFGWDDFAVVWLNGQKLLDEKEGMRSCIGGLVPAEKKFTAYLKKGDNFLVVKILNGGGVGGFSIQPYDDKGNWPEGVESMIPLSGTAK
ncbi:MAG: LamG-like jellyroll fold domain-containing protein [Victivallales bacterium]